MKSAGNLFQKIKAILCCCCNDKANPDELMPLKASHNSSNRSKFQQNKQPPLSSSLFQSADQEEPIFEPSITDIMNQVSSGDDDEPLDPSQEKYEQILKRIED